jgi:2-polyprenyl-3-methyl-5-hydroxy-6-metoxy-1,4-benzoquinol methylase
MDNSRSQTNESFRQKWTNGPASFVSTTMDENSEIFSWILKRNGFNSPSEFEDWLSPRGRILDAGCGNGRITGLLRKYSQSESEILGIDYSSHEIAKSNFGSLTNTQFMYADLMEDLSSLGTFDLIYCQEVLHHTEDPRYSFHNLVKLLKPGGEIAIYVYKKKSELREFSDDFVRQAIQDLSFEETREVISQITDFARSISQIQGVFKFPEIPILGIKSSEQTIHRFIYNNVFKNFWNDELTYEENFLINFDWYHPSTCFRHTLSEVNDWFNEFHLTVLHAVEDDFGITMRGRS